MILILTRCGGQVEVFYVFVPLFKLVDASFLFSKDLLFQVNVIKLVDDLAFLGKNTRLLIMLKLHFNLEHLLFKSAFYLKDVTK